MVSTTSRISYSDCFDLLDQAIADFRGTRIKFRFRGDAINFRLRLHMARRIDREENADTYESTHPMYGRSIYDELIVRLRGGDETWWLYLEKSSASTFEVESLSEVDDQEEFEESKPIPLVLEQAGVISVRRRI